MSSVSLLAPAGRTHDCSQAYEAGRTARTRRRRKPGTPGPATAKRVGAARTGGSRFCGTISCTSGKVTPIVQYSIGRGSNGGESL
jgi:hypothetical protein